MRELWQESAQSLARLISTGGVSSREVVDSHRAWIEALNDQVNAVVEVRPDEFRAAVDTIEAFERAVGVLTPIDPRL